MRETGYTSEYFDGQQEVAKRSAAVIVPVVVDLLEPRSVCDVGCARGTWLNVFAEHGVEDIYGIDGEHIRREELEIPEDRFVEADLRQGFTVDRKFDLAVSLEVAEHLPQESAERFVDSLVRLAPAVLFSAAIPQQSGRGHVNEQWPDYWDGHFQRNGYLAVDCVRPKVWKARRVPAWYLQNTILFVEAGFLRSHSRLAAEYECSKTRPLSIAHPMMFERVANRHLIQLKRLMESLDAGHLSEEEFRARLAGIVSRSEQWLE